MSTIRVYGASDDLIEVEGYLSEEFPCPQDDDGRDRALLAFSTGVVLEVEYGSEGIWRIRQVGGSSDQVKIDLNPPEDDDRYSDVAELLEPAEWVVLGTQIVKRRRPQ